MTEIATRDEGRFLTDPQYEPPVVPRGDRRRVDKAAMEAVGLNHAEVEKWTNGSITH